MACKAQGTRTFKQCAWTVPGGQHKIVALLTSVEATTANAVSAA